MEYITILHASISRTDEKDFEIDVEHYRTVKNEVDWVIDDIGDFLKGAGYDLTINYRLEVDGYAPD